MKAKTIEELKVGDEIAVFEINQGKRQKDNIGKPGNWQKCYGTRKECKYKCSELCKESF